MNAATFSTSALRVPGRYFYVWMALGFVFVAFGGFVPTYWAKLATGTFQGAPILHLHGALMFTWVLFYFAQTLLVATGRTLDHRQWGLAGIALFTLLLCSILAGQLSVLKHADLAGVGDAARRFAAVTLCGWTFIAALFAVAIANVRRPEVHKRLMVVMLAGMMTPAIARVFLTVVMGGAGGFLHLVGREFAVGAAEFGEQRRVGAGVIFGLRREEQACDVIGAAAEQGGDGVETADDVLGHDRARV